MSIMPNISAPIVVSIDKVRADPVVAERLCGHIAGMTLEKALQALRFQPEFAHPNMAAAIDKAAFQVLSRNQKPAEMVIQRIDVDDGEVVTRLRRVAHGKTDWINTPTLKITLTVNKETAADDCALRQVCVRSKFKTNDELQRTSCLPVVSHLREDLGDHPVMQALVSVLDPDIGINIVDIGFVRGWTIEDRSARVKLALTNPHCRMTAVFRNQVRNALTKADIADEIDVDFTFEPAWAPADISEPGRAYLREIGFQSL